MGGDCEEFWRMDIRGNVGLKMQKRHAGPTRRLCEKCIEKTAKEAKALSEAEDTSRKLDVVQLCVREVLDGQPAIYHGHCFSFLTFTL